MLICFAVLQHATRNASGQSFTLNYDAENRLVSVTGAATASFVYDADGKQVKSIVGGVTTYYVGQHYEKKGTMVTKYYFAGAMQLAVRTGGTLSYLLGDHLGSTSVVAALSGALPTDYTYTGQYSHVDDFSLMYYVARWYDPALGRFAQADTIVPGAGNPSAWERYAYVNNNAINVNPSAWERYATNNNPVRYNDPSGHAVECGAGIDDCEGNTNGSGGSSDDLETDLDNSNRLPDYITLNIGFSIPGVGTLVSGQVPIILDRYGNLYVGLGFALGPEAPLGASASLSGGYISSWSSLDPGQTREGPPGKQRSEEILSGGFANGVLYFGMCVGGTASLSKPFVGLEVFGIGFPQASVGFGSSTLLLDFTPDNGVPIW